MADQTDALPLSPTLESSLGPYYPRRFFLDDRHDLAVYADGAVVKPAGPVVTLHGEIRDVSGRPIDLAVIEFWHADAAGRLREPGNLGDPTLDPWFLGYGRQYCEGGRYSLRTVMPGPIPPAADFGAWRAPLVTFNIFCDGIDRLATQIFFSGEKLNEADPLLLSLPEALRGRLIAVREADDAAGRRYRLDITLRGAAETPFFDDLES